LDSGTENPTKEEAIQSLEPSVFLQNNLDLEKVSSTDKASCKFIDEILICLNDKMHVSGIFCGLAKAFACMNHDILLSKHCERGMWLTLVTSFKQIPVANFLQLITKVHNMQPL
jgi:hypothetical protein